NGRTRRFSSFSRNSPKVGLSPSSSWARLWRHVLAGVPLLVCHSVGEFSVGFGSAVIATKSSSFCHREPPWGHANSVSGSAVRWFGLRGLAVMLPPHSAAWGQLDDQRLADARWRMVQEGGMAAGVREPRVLVAMRNTLRLHLVLPAYRQQA